MAGSWFNPRLAKEPPFWRSSLSHPPPRRRLLHDPSNPRDGFSPAPVFQPKTFLSFSCEPCMQKIRVLIADDHTLMREGLRALLGPEVDIEVIAEAGTGREAVHLARTLEPDIVLMDIAMPLLSGL